MSTKDARAQLLERLADEPPPTFVGLRKQLAAEQKSAGDPAGAKAMLARRRPSWTSWALGRLARQQPTTLTKAIAARATLAEAVKDGEKIAAAQAAFSRALEVAGKAARVEMEKAGHGGAAGEARKLRNVLRHVAEHGEHVLPQLEGGDFAEPADDAAPTDDAEDGGFLAAAGALPTLVRPHVEQARRETFDPGCPEGCARRSRGES